MAAHGLSQHRPRGRAHPLLGVIATVAISSQALSAQPPSGCPTEGPGARSGHSLAYDEKLAAVVLQGGLAANGTAPFPRSTWAWTGTAWRCLVSRGPVGRLDAHLAWDATSQRLVFFGGRQLTREHASIFLRDTWTFDGTEWTRADTAGPGPRLHGAMAHDASRGALLLHGGASAEEMLRDSWAWREGRWEPVALTAPENALGNSLSATHAGTFLLLAVRDTTPGCIGRRRAAMYLVRGDSLMPAAGGRGPCFSPQAPATTTGDGVLLFAGWNGTEASIPAETWHWSTGGWRRAEGSPPKRRGASMAWDARRGRAVLFGGEGEQGLLADVWEWDGAHWSEVRTRPDHEEPVR